MAVSPLTRHFVCLSKNWPSMYTCKRHAILSLTKSHREVSTNCISKTFGAISRILHSTQTCSTYGKVTVPQKISIKQLSSSIPDDLDVREFITSKTSLCNEHLTPEVMLHLVTPACELWHSTGEDVPVPDPFWAFYWPGGQALTRYVLDHPNLVRNKVVLDVGSGCGASAIACAKAGASRVIANDICEVAAAAIAMNAKENKVTLDISTEDLMGLVQDSWDVVLLGDMCYDEDFTKQLISWLDKLSQEGKSILIGDPGRMFLQKLARGSIEYLMEYKLHGPTLLENRGLNIGTVYQYTCKK